MSFSSVCRIRDEWKISTRNVVFAMVVSLLAALAAAPASAALVSVTGGFTSFSSSNVFGAVANPTYLNGVRLCPDSGCSILQGPASVTFGAPLSSVNFQVLDSPPPL